MARPTLLQSNERITAFHANIRNGASISTAAHAAGIGASTVYAWLATAELLTHRNREQLTDNEQALLEFRDTTLHARAQHEQRLINIINHEIDANNWKAAVWMLERSFPERWSSKRSDSEDEQTLRRITLFPDEMLSP